MLNVAQLPGMISFAGGLPAPETFAPLDFPHAPAGLLQYGPSEGEPPLRAKIANDLSALGLDCTAERVLVLSGSQQGIDLAAKLLIDPGSLIALESPAYLAALQVFRFFGAQFCPLAQGPAEQAQAGPVMAYVTPTFHNPTGRCWPEDERRAFASTCDQHDLVLFEDDPYRDLAYEPCDRGPVCSYLKRASWIYQGSFSKTVAPGLRLGFLTASADLFPHLVRLKQAADLHTSRLSQWIVLQLLESPDREVRQARIAETYRSKRDLFDEALKRHLGLMAEWQLPTGGMFFWVTLAPHIDVDQLFARAVEQKVLFTPGTHFTAHGEKSNAMRLNFSLADAESAERGLQVLGGLARELAQS
jgi:DNA-binding transcriptional MocR family regulator